MTSRLGRGKDLVNSALTAIEPATGPGAWQLRAAKLLVDQHGADAPIRAAQRADELLGAGDIEGRSVWLRILRAVKELMATKPPGQVH
jgi:hypothetical protein